MWLWATFVYVLKCIHVCVYVQYLLFKTDIQAKNKSLVFMVCYCGLMPVSAGAFSWLAVPLFAEVSPCFDNITFRFCKL